MQAIHIKWCNSRQLNLRAMLVCGFVGLWVPRELPRCDVNLVPVLRVKKESGHPVRRW